MVHGFSKVGLLLWVWATISMGLEQSEPLSGDVSNFVSVTFKDNRWQIVPGMLDWSQDDSVVAIANFTNAQLSTGWNFLEIKTKESSPDVIQAQAAGLAEGFLCRTFIEEQYMEFYTRDVCATDKEACHWIFDRLRSNRKQMTENLTNLSKSSPYWHQVNLISVQLDGIHQGFKLKSIETNQTSILSDPNLDLVTWLVNFPADFWDLRQLYKALTTSNQTNTPEDIHSPSRPSCSVIIKYVPQRSDLFVAHNTWHEYRTMGYRVLKSYELNVHTLPDQKVLVPGHTITMSSYAGVVSSLDDLYLTSAGLTATETTLFVYNTELYLQTLPEGSILEPIRVMVANRLAKTGQEWTDLFQEPNSGTYNNQWMIIDYNKFNESPSSLKDGVLTVLEQLPGKIVVDDQTDSLRNQTYWGSYNRAFYPEVFKLSGAQAKVDEFGPWFSHHRNPRALIIARDHIKVHDMDSLTDFMWYNDFENDPLAQVEGCSPLQTPAGSIANRLDLSDPSGNCTFIEHDWMVGHWGYGAIDAKMVSKDSFPDLTFRAVAGPTHSQHVPFAWSTTNIDGIPKFRPIDTFNFEAFNLTWTMNQASA